MEIVVCYYDGVLIAFGDTALPDLIHPGALFLFAEGRLQIISAASSSAAMWSHHSARTMKTEHTAPKPAQVRANFTGRPPFLCSCPEIFFSPPSWVRPCFDGQITLQGEVARFHRSVTLCLRAACRTVYHGVVSQAVMYQHSRWWAAPESHRPPAAQRCLSSAVPEICLRPYKARLATKRIDLTAGLRFSRGGAAHSPRAARGSCVGVPARSSCAVCRIEALPELRRGRLGGRGGGAAPYGLRLV